MFGSPQATGTQFGQMVQGNSCQSCDSGDHMRSANGLMHNDTAGSETLYLQAQRDCSKAIKNNHVTNVGANQICHVSGNNTLVVGGFDATYVVHDRELDIGGDQSHYVGGNVLVQGQKDLTHATPKGQQAYVAKSAITLKATDKEIKLVMGTTSVILLRPDGILISAPDVFINPGDKFMAVVNSNGSFADASKVQALHDAAPAMIAANNEQINALQVMTGMEGADLDSIQSSINGLNADNERLKGL
jgi:hypothetical protein